MIEIKDISGKTRFSTSINKGAKGKFTLMKEDYIILPFSVPTPIPFKLGDYVDLSGVLDESLGGKLAKIYEITDLQKPTYNSSTGGYDYELQMNAYYWKWKNKIFKYTPEHAGNEASWSLTASLDVQLGVFLRNLKALGYTYKGTDFTFSIDDTVENKAVAMTYDNMNLLDALFSMAGEDKWNCDCWITDNVIHFGRNEFGDAVKIERGVEASSITRSESQGTYATRIYAFGSTKNIPTNYRPTDEQTVVNGVVQKRLMLPSGTPYLDAYEGMSQEEAIEDVVVFDDVYPRRVGTLSDVHTRTEEVENEDGTKETVTYYRYKDTGLEFKEEYKLEENLKIRFQSGLLNRLEFEVLFNPSPKDETRGEQLWEIVRNENYGRPLPDDMMYPADGDEYILSGFDIQLVSDQYIPAAERELKEKAQKYADKVKKDDGTYPTTLRSDWVHEDPISRTFEFGQRINLVDDTYFENGRISRVLGWEMNLDIPWDSPVYTIGESMPYSRIGEIEDKVDSLTYKGHTYTGGAGGVYLIKVNDSTAASDSNAFSALRSIKEFVSKRREDTAYGKIHFLQGADFGNYNVGESGGTVDSEGNAEWLTAVIRELLRSVRFVDGMTGEGWRLWMDALTGLSNLTIDKVTIRQTLVALELLIQKVRSIGGQFVISAASGKIKTVTRDGDNYKITFEQDNEFVANDLMRCAEFTGASLRGYWVEVSSSDGNGITIPVREFGGVEPKEGDECVLMGNTQNRLRQNLISIAATEDGQPRVDVLDGVCEKNFNGCLRVRLGNLDGISDSRFPADNQPHGNGLYGDNVYLMGTFVLTTGEDILTRFEITEGKIHSAVESLRKEIREEQSYLDNSSFADGMDKWKTGSKATLFTLGGRWIWANGGPYGTKPDGHAEIRTDGKVPYAYIRNSYIMQKLEDFRLVPEYRQTNSQGERVPGVVYLSFSYRVVKAGRLKIEFVGADKTGFENFNMFGHEEDLPVGGEKMFTLDGLWNGTGDFKLSFTGVIYISLLVFSTNKADALAYKYRTLFEQSDRLVKISAAVFDKDGEALKETGLVVKPEGSGIYMQTADGKLALIGVGLEEEDEYGHTRTVVKLTGDNIRLEGDLTANGTFHVDEDGAVHANKGTIGAFSMNGYWLENTDGNEAAVSIKSYHTEYSHDGEIKVLDNEASLGNTLPANAGVQTNAMFRSIGKDTNGNAAIILQARNCTRNVWAGGLANLAVDAEGGCRWRMNEGDHWCMPGFLLWLHIDVSRDFKLTTQTFGNGLEMYNVNVVQNENNQRGQNYVYVYFYCKHDRVRISAISEGQDWEESGKWGLTPCCEGIYTDKVASNGLTRKKAVFSFWKGGDKFVPNHATFFFFGEPSDGLEY